MLTPQQQRAADLIWQHWQAGTVLPDLPPELKPRTRADGYAIQAGLDRRSVRPRAGWKIAATSAAGQKHIGVDGPLAGRILAEFVRAEGQQLSLATNRMRVAEPEFAFRFARELTPQARAYTVDEVLAAVGSLHTAIELPDSRFADFAQVGGPTLIAEAACARELIIGAAVAADWRAVDLSQHQVRASIRGPGGMETRDGSGGNVLGDPREALTWLVNELSGLALGLRPGEIVTTGTCMVPVALEPGLQIDFDFGTLGRTSMSIAQT